jgi:hypothetical protein
MRRSLVTTLCITLCILEYVRGASQARRYRGREAQNALAKFLRLAGSSKSNVELVLTTQDNSTVILRWSGRRLMVQYGRLPMPDERLLEKGGVS